MNEELKFSLRDLGFLDGLIKKEPSREHILKKEYRDGYSAGLQKYYMKLYEII